jgi:hypothetical protein
MNDNLGNGYFREYRKSLGFTNQTEAKTFLAAKDVQSEIDNDYIIRLNARLVEIITKVHSLIEPNLRPDNLDDFVTDQIEKVYQQVTIQGLLLKMNNLGRRREEVYFSWLRGRVVAAYFNKYLAKMFDVDPESINIIGDDEILDPEIFRKTPTADLLIHSGDLRIRVEVQSGFQGVNDIKQHKVIEARRVRREEGTSTVVVHFDFFNGQAALVDVSRIDEDDINWITRQQMEGQTVFNINQDLFFGKLSELPSIDILEFLGQE